MKPENYHYFVSKNPHFAPDAFSAYTDRETNMLMCIYKGRKEKIGGVLVDVPHRWKFDSAHRSIRVHKNDRSLLPTTYLDELGNEQTTFITSYDFLRKYPFCKGSPNGGADWTFSELREHDDAVTAVEAKQIQLKAMNAIMNLDKSGLKEMSALYAYFDTDDAKQRHYLLEKAGADPSEFLDLYDAPEKSAKALLAKAVSLQVVKRRGSIHTWENVTLGADEAEAIVKLMKDEDLMEALRKVVKGNL